MLSHKKPIHHTATGFRNLPPHDVHPRPHFKQILKFAGRRLQEGLSGSNKPDLPDGFIVDEYDVVEKIKSGGHQMTWLGHSCFVIQSHNLSIITDPFLGPYASPIYGFGPKRLTPPGICPQNLPAMDIILISHNHYDHLDKRTLRYIKNKNDVHVVVPLRLGQILRRWGFSHVIELDWYESTVIKGATITLLPTVHFSSRIGFDYNRTLWGSFHISTPGHKFYFAGDTAYSDLFDDIGTQYKADYAMVPIGAYEPYDLMQWSHCTPEDAARIGHYFGAHTLIGMHWGTVTLSDEPFFDPPRRFIAGGEALGYPMDNVWCFGIGETKDL